jgi:hypothetical protein
MKLFVLAGHRTILAHWNIWNNIGEIKERTKSHQSFEPVHTVDACCS